MGKSTNVHSELRILRAPDHISSRGSGMADTFSALDLSNRTLLSDVRNSNTYTDNYNEYKNGDDSTYTSTALDLSNKSVTSDEGCSSTATKENYNEYNNDDDSTYTSSALDLSNRIVASNEGSSRNIRKNNYNEIIIKEIMGNYNDPTIANDTEDSTFMVGTLKVKNSMLDELLNERKMELLSDPEVISLLSSAVQQSENPIYRK